MNAKLFWAIQGIIMGGIDKVLPPLSPGIDKVSHVVFQEELGNKWVFSEVLENLVTQMFQGACLSGKAGIIGDVTSLFISPRHAFQSITKSTLHILRCSLAIWLFQMFRRASGKKMKRISNPE